MATPKELALNIKTNVETLIMAMNDAKARGVTVNFTIETNPTGVYELKRFEASALLT